MGGLDLELMILRVALIGSLMAATILRVEVWRSHVTLYQATVSESPLKVRPRLGLAMAYLRAGRTADGIRELDNANLLARMNRDVRGNDMAILQARMNAGNLLFDSAQLPDGRADMDRLLQAHDVLADLWNERHFPGAAVNLSLIYLQMDQPKDALALIDNGIRRLPDYKWFDLWAHELYIAKFDILRALGDCAGAIESFNIAKRRDADLIETPPCPLQQGAF